MDTRIKTLQGLASDIGRLQRESGKVMATAGTDGPGACRIAGMHRYYIDAELAARYPNAKAYFAAATKLTKSNVDRGYLLPSDAARSNAHAHAV